ncbi:hypothetical protein ACSNOJ_13745 [Streptomyces sp. URMC 128]|uniref:hypothetical protein n=1 Tax=Streptomyces sp. URMC 128 TaxID=3423404 RepID=UPI003F1DCE6B
MPVPAQGLDGHRVELGEAFCRAQSTLLSRSPFRPKASWQRRTNITELRRFWESMGHREQHNSKVR